MILGLNHENLKGKEELEELKNVNEDAFGH